MSLAEERACAEPGGCLIEVDGLVKRYGQRVAVDGLSFSVQPGELFGLLGPNGAGKTTTMSVLATLLRPDGGQVRLCGRDLVREPERVRPLIGHVPQDLALYGSLDARENLAFFGRIYGLSGRRLRARVDELLGAVGLSERAREPVEGFSGGMKRRLNLAASLMHGPRIVFFDEPTVGVDPQSRNFIFEFIERLKADGVTMIYTTHYMEEASRMCDRVAIVDQGRLLALDTLPGLVALLGGGVVHLEVERPEALLEAVRALPLARDARLEGGRIEVRTPETDRALHALVELCHARGARLTSLRVLEPNLESVFLHLTGKGLRDS
jgi:ABC-2 type transport system ATP-binding protein